MGSMGSQQCGTCGLCIGGDPAAAAADTKKDAADTAPAGAQASSVRRPDGENVPSTATVHATATDQLLLTLPSDPPVAEPKPTLEAVREEVATKEALKPTSGEMQQAYLPAAMSPDEVQPPGEQTHSAEGITTPPEQPSAPGSRRPSLTDDNGKKQGKPFPKRPYTSKLGPAVWKKAEEVFTQMDKDGSNAVTREEATEFFTGGFPKLSVEAMFNEVDTDQSNEITADEFMKFWLQVRHAGYTDQAILETMDELLSGEAWVDWKDGRSVTTKTAEAFPKRPMFSKLPKTTWTLCEQLFKKIDTDKTLVITRENALAHFQGNFKTVSTDAMFREVDENDQGTISAIEWMDFWKQVKNTGLYSNKDIEEELRNLMEGGSWVDWKDNRKT